MGEEGGVAIAQVTDGVTHHDPQGSSNLQRT